MATCGLLPLADAEVQVRLGAGLVGVGIAIAFSRIGTIIATYGTPLFLAAYGIGPTMLIAAGLVILGLVLSAFMAPETKGKSLLETSSLDEGGAHPRGA